jgi:hypothetical protein
MWGKHQVQVQLEGHVPLVNLFIYFRSLHFTYNTKLVPNYIPYLYHIQL